LNWECHELKLTQKSNIIDFKNWRIRAQRSLHFIGQGLFQDWVPSVVGSREEIFVALDWTDFASNGGRRN